MKKLKLQVDELQVESFSIRAATSRGTVRGAAPTLSPFENTCAFHCDRPTWAEETCDDLCVTDNCYISQPNTCVSCAFCPTHYTNECVCPTVKC
jgi:hypothetical protein